MRNFKLVIQYDGSRYKGWQKQKDNELTIQGKLEAVLSKMAEETVEVIGCERTDVGTHAQNYVANFQTSCTLSEELILNYLYEFLPDDIVVKSVEEVNERFHARYNVKSKTYIYSVQNTMFRDVFNRKYTYHMDDELNLGNMQEAANLLVGTHDFQSFTSTKAGTKSTIRTIETIEIVKVGELVQIRIKANDFLWHMPRFIVGVLLEVGTGYMKLENINILLTEQKKAQAGIMAKPKALCLESVEY